MAKNHSEGFNVDLLSNLLTIELPWLNSNANFQTDAFCKLTLTKAVWGTSWCWVSFLKTSLKVAGISQGPGAGPFSDPSTNWPERWKCHFQISKY